MLGQTGELQLQQGVILPRETAATGSLLSEFAQLSSWPDLVTAVGGETAAGVSHHSAPSRARRYRTTIPSVSSGVHTPSLFRHSGLTKQAVVLVNQLKVPEKAVSRYLTRACCGRGVAAGLAAGTPGQLQTLASLRPAAMLCGERNRKG